MVMRRLDGIEPYAPVGDISDGPIARPPAGTARDRAILGQLFSYVLPAIRLHDLTQEKTTPFRMGH